MKGVKVNLEMVNCVLLLVILGLTVTCCVKQKDNFTHCHCAHNKNKK